MPDIFDALVADKKTVKPVSKQSAARVTSDVFDEVLASQSEANQLPVLRPGFETMNPNEMMPFERSVFLRQQRQGMGEKGFDERHPTTSKFLDIVTGQANPETQVGAAATGVVEGVAPSLDPRHYFTGPARLLGVDPDKGTVSFDTAADSLGLLGEAAAEGMRQQAEKAGLQGFTPEHAIGNALFKFGKELVEDVRTMPERFVEDQNKPLSEKLEDAVTFGVVPFAEPLKKLFPGATAQAGEIALAPIPFLGRGISQDAEIANDPTQPDTERTRARARVGSVVASTIGGARTARTAQRQGLKVAVTNPIVDTVRDVSTKSDVFDEVAAELGKVDNGTQAAAPVNEAPAAPKISRADRVALRQKGFADEQINNMSAEDARSNLAKTNPESGQISADEIAPAVKQEAGEAPGANTAPLKAKSSEPPPVSERLAAIRRAQDAKTNTPELAKPTLREKLPELAKEASRRFYDRFRDWREVSRDLKERGVHLDAAENPDFVLDISYGGAGGRIQASAIELKRTIDEAAKAGAKEDLRDFLNLTGYRRAFQTLEQRKADATARFERHNYNAARGQHDAKAMAAEASREIAAIENRIIGRKVVPQYASLDEVQADMNTLRAVRGEARFNHIAKLANRVFDLNARAWKEAYEGGLISKSVYEQGLARGKEYIPLERIFEDEAGSRGPSTPYILDLKNQKVLRRLEGSERYNRDPFAASLDRVAETTREVERNKAAKVAVKALLRDKDFYADQVSLVEHRKVDYFGAKKEGVNVLPKAPEDGRGTISFYEDGEKFTYAVPKLLADALTIANNQNQLQLASGMLLDLPRRVFRAGATGSNLAFMLKNVPRDVFDLHLLSKASSGLSATEMAKFQYRWLQSFYDSLTRNERYLDFLRSGAANSTLQKQITPQTFLRLDRGSRVKDVFGEVIDSVAKLNSAAEEATKMTALKTLRERGLSETEAVIETRRFGGSPDFARRGSHSRDIDLAMMFFNVGLQGTGRLFNRGAGVATNPKLWTAATMATLSLYANNAQFIGTDGVREWDRVPASDKRNFWVILRPETYRTDDGVVRHKAWKVPKPQGVRAWFNSLEDTADLAVTGKGSVVQTGLNVVSDLLPGQFNLKEDRLTSSAGQGLLTSLNPAIKVPLELAGNKDSFTGVPIVPKRLENAPAAAQKTLFTSPTAVKIGEALDLSPMKLQHSIRGFFGGVGDQGVALADLAQPRARKLDRLEGDQLTANLPVLGIFLRGFVGSAADQVEREAAQRFYEDVDRALTLHAHFETIKQSDVAGAKKLLSDPEQAAYITFAPALKRTVGVLAEMRRLEEQVETSSMPAEEARKKMRFLRDKRLEAFRQSERLAQLVESAKRKSRLLFEAKR